MTGATIAGYVTFEEFEQMPEQPGKQELLKGELIELPPAKLKHNEISERLYRRVFAILAEAHGRAECAALGKAHHEMGYRMGNHSWLQPDVSITHSAQQADDYYLGSPALVVEVISGEKTADHIDGKIEEYWKNGVLEIWVVYPVRKHVWIYRPGTAELRSGAFPSELLAGGEIDLNEILK